MDKDRVIRAEYSKGTPIKEIARLVGIHRSNVIGRANKMGIVHPNSNAGRVTLGTASSTQEAKMARKSKAELTNEARLESQLRSLDRSKREKDRKHRVLQDELAATQKALTAALEITNRKPNIFKIPSPRDRKRGEGTAVALLSDVHCEEIISASKVNYLNKHNPDISKKRVSKFFELLVRFIRVERQETEVNNLILWLGGDFFTSSESHGTPVAFPTSIAVMFAQDMICSGIKYLCEQEPNLKIHVVGSVGNHSRKESHKPVNQANEQELSLEWIMYHAIKQVFAGDKNITFQLDNSYHSYVKVYGKTIRFNHGHIGWRYNQGLGGVHGPLWKVISQTWDNQIAADLTCCGHYHTLTPASLGRPYMVNGSTIGASPYGISYGYEEPAQMFFLLHSKYGVVGQRPLFVDM